MPRRKRRKAVARKRLGKRRMMRRGRATGISGAIQSLRGYHGELRAQRSALDAQIHAVENALAVMGSPGALPRVGRGPGRPPGRRAGGGRGRGPRPGSLKSYVLDVLTGSGVMAVKDITAGVLAAGYKTKNRTLAKSVGIALTELKNVAKVGRGRFRLK
jgi:hypothetical protein